MRGTNAFHVWGEEVCMWAFLSCTRAKKPLIADLWFCWQESWQQGSGAWLVNVNVNVNDNNNAEHATIGVVNCNPEDFSVWFLVHCLSQSNHSIFVTIDTLSKVFQEKFFQIRKHVLWRTLLLKSHPFTYTVNNDHVQRQREWRDMSRWSHQTFSDVRLNSSNIATPRYTVQ
jgi:hypothetical protein